MKVTKTAVAARQYFPNSDLDRVLLSHNEKELNRDEFCELVRIIELLMTEHDDQK